MSAVSLRCSSAELGHERAGGACRPACSRSWASGAPGELAVRAYNPDPRDRRLACGRLGGRGERRGLALPGRHRHDRDARARPAGARGRAPGGRASSARRTAGSRRSRPPAGAAAARVGHALPGRPPARRRRRSSGCASTSSRCCATCAWPCATSCPWSSGSRR